MNRMITTKRFTRLVAMACSAILLAAANAAGEGFRNSPPGAFNLGRAGGRIAQIDDASAVQQNPANLADLSLTEFQLAPSFIYYSTEFKSTTGQISKSQDPWKFLPNGFGSMPLFDGNLSLGVGLTVPFGLSNDWDPGSPAF